MMNAMKQEVQGEELWAVRQVKVYVEQETVEGVLQKSPDKVAEEETRQCLHKGFQGRIKKDRQREHRL